jgi:hypothetical protein
LKNCHVLRKETIDIIIVVFTAIAALAAAIALFLSFLERKSNMKKDFILWAIERLRNDEQRIIRGTILNYTASDIQRLLSCKPDQTDTLKEIDNIRQVCLCFDEIGYFVYRMGLVDFRDILDIYPQAIKIWNKIAFLIKKWRIDHQDPTSFIYFEMLVKQKKFDPCHIFVKPIDIQI